MLAGVIGFGVVFFIVTVMPQLPRRLAILKAVAPGQQIRYLFDTQGKAAVSTSGSARGA